MGLRSLDFRYLGFNAIDVKAVGFSSDKGLFLL